MTVGQRIDPWDIMLLPGDGVGPEVMRQVRRILGVLAHHVPLRLQEGLIGGAAIYETGHPLPEDTLRRCLDADAVLLGAVGGPEWDDQPPERRPEAALLGIRREMGLYANIRPVHMRPALARISPLRDESLGGGVDLVIVRELAGGLYYGPRGLEDEEEDARAFDTLSYRRSEIVRVVKRAFQLAGRRKKKLTSVDKANVLATSRLWRRIVSEVAVQHHDVEVDHLYVDNCAMQMVLDPGRFDVLVIENTFGDILSDLGGALLGSIGILPSASVGDEGGPHLYEPVHGSAPDIAGSGKANPLAAILSTAMMFDMKLGRFDLADHIEASVDQALAEGLTTGDVTPRGAPTATTDEVGQRVAEILKVRTGS